jgi:replicative DNA helicase
MSYLTARAEQALIGAMLADQPLPGELNYLQPDDFGHRVLRQTYTAILELCDTTPLAQLPDAVAARVDTPGLDADWLRELRDTCPSPAHIAAYARMVQVSAFRREMAVQGERIATTAVAGRPTDATQTAMSRMSDALTRQAQVYAAFTAIEEGQALRVWHTRTDQHHTVAVNERATREDQLLADLLAHPEQTRDVARIVGPDNLGTQQRREVFETLVMLAEAGDPVDEIILIWEIERQRATAELYGQARHIETHAEPTAAYVARLAATTVVTGTAITIGYELILADTRAELDAARTASQTRQVIEINGPERTQALQARPQFDPNLLPPDTPTPGQQPKIDL